MTNYDDHPQTDLDSRARKAVAAVHSVVGRHLARTVTDVRRRAPHRRRLLVALAVVLVVVVVGLIAVARRNTTEHAATVGGHPALQPFAPTVLPPGWQIRAAAVSDAARPRIPAVLYANPESLGKPGANGLLVQATTAQTIAGSAAACERSGPAVPRAVTVEPCQGFARSARVKVSGVVLELDALATLSDQDLLRAAYSVILSADRPVVPASALPQGVRDLGIVNAPTVRSTFLSGTPSPPAGGYTEFFGPPTSVDSVWPLGIELNAAPAGPADLAFASFGANLCPPKESCRQVAVTPVSVDIAGSAGWLEYSGVSPAPVPVVFWVHDGQLLRLDGYGITEEQTLAAARSMQPVDARRWATFLQIGRAAGSDGSKGGAEMATTTSVVPTAAVERALGPVPAGEFLVADGVFEAAPWRVTVRPGSSNLGATLCVQAQAGAMCTGNSDKPPDKDDVTVLFGPDNGPPAPPTLFAGYVGPDITGIGMETHSAPGAPVVQQSDLYLRDASHGLKRRVFIVVGSSGTAADQIRFSTKGGGTVTPASRHVVQPPGSGAPSPTTR